MFIALAAAASLIITVIELLFFTEQRSAKEVIRITFRNLFVIGTSSIAVQRYVMKYQHFLDASGYHTKNFIKFFVVALIVGLIWEFIFAVVKHVLVFEAADAPKHRAGAATLRVVSLVLFALGAAAFFGTVWGTDAFGEVTGDQLIINLTSPTEGTEASVYTDGFEGPVFQTLFVTSIFGLLNFSKFKLVLQKLQKRKVVFSELAKRIICFLLALGFLCYGVHFGYQKFDLQKVFNTYVLKSDIIDKTYADPETVKVTFPEKKRNLIHIYLESAENSFLSKDLGGNIDENLMPNLTELAYTGTVFSDTDLYFGGPEKGTGTQWSIASMVNQTSGLPMKAPGVHNAYGTEGNFLPGAYTLGELLEKEGYEQTVMFGADANFGGLRYYYETHGNWKLMDYRYALQHKMLPKDYKVWWGFEDDKLYKFAVHEIIRLYKTGKPFNFTMETADTHRPGGYITPGKKMPYKSHYANAIWNSDRDVVKFIKWLQTMPFYENTTIVVIGDHTSMETQFFEEYHFNENYKRTQFNLIINPAPSVGKLDKKITTNRKWANWDYFPTIVASLGAEIEGDRLGIGTNLFSGKPTIYEEDGDVKRVNRELSKGSKLYNEEILETDGTIKGSGANYRTKK